MKKLIVMLLPIVSVIFLSACGNIESSATENEDKKTFVGKVGDEEKGPTQAESNKQLKNNAVEVDFSNLDSLQNGDPLKITGKVSFESKNLKVGDEFKVTTEDGVFNILNMQEAKDITQGELVTIYGNFAGESTETGLPEMTARLVE